MMKPHPVIFAAALGWVALAAGATHAAPIGPANYDFATFGTPQLTLDAAHYGGWTQVLASDTLELAGSTDVTPSAQAWVSQHPNYNGLNLVIRGTYPPLLDWYFIDYTGGGWQAQSQICYDPGLPSAHCVSHVE